MSKNLRFAVDLAKAAGQIIKDNFSLGMDKSWKSDHTPVTGVDFLVNDLVNNAARETFPEYSFISEEGSRLIEGSDYVWICDPIDGTIPYSHGIPTCVFSLALVHKGESVLGVIYDPFLNRLFYAERNKGAYLNDMRISVSRAEGLENTVIGIGFWKEAKYDLLRLTGELKSQSIKTVDVCSGIYLGALVASGELVAAISPSDKAYDAASLKIIVEEAGGIVTSLFGKEQRYDIDVEGYLATNAILHPILINLIGTCVTR